MRQNRERSVLLEDGSVRDDRASSRIFIIRMLTCVSNLHVLVFQLHKPLLLRVNCSTGWMADLSVRVERPASSNQR